MILVPMMSVLRFDDNEDPITGFLTHDWASVGGWSMFVALAVLIVIGAFRETWIPGRRYRRLEQAAQRLADANDKLTEQNGQLITANEITKHFFEETVPKRTSLFEDTQPVQRSSTFGLEQTQPRHALYIPPEETAPKRGDHP